MLHFFLNPEHRYWTFSILLLGNLWLLVPALKLLKQHLTKKKPTADKLSLEAGQLQNNRRMIILLCVLLSVMALFEASYVTVAMLKIDDVNVSLGQGDNAAKNYRSVRAKKQLFGHETGHFFLVELKDAKLREIINFKGGWYTFDSDNQDYQAAMDELGNNISHYDGFYNYRIFVRGKADSVDDKKFDGIYDPAYRFDTCHYFKDISVGKVGTKFNRTPFLLHFPLHIHNTHLPALRSAFFASQLRNSGANFKNIYILEGKVEQTRDAKQRNISMLLHVEDGDSAFVRSAVVQGSFLFLLVMLFFMGIIVWLLRENRKILNRIEKRRMLLLQRQALLISNNKK
jgi:cbb3-type cytochrome oxidase subunit 3